MATVINNPTPERTIIERTSDSGAGWAVAVIILLAVIVGGAYAWSRYHKAAPATPGTANINVTLPAGTGDGNDNPAQ